MSTKIEGTLPVAIKILDGQTEVKGKNVVMHQMTAIQFIQSQAGLDEGQFIAIADLSSMTKLIDEKGNEHALSYEALGNSSRANMDYLSRLKVQLDAKEAAEN
ncbi:hypothetical protein EC844_12616 [Acinetobacter calcoaceticus]|uniref:Uncharacterized protein n=1 Tax=Acinetobacter calcoaceticus TaxID=471 RepID=A0A4R1XGL0_ACICA|nr:hypothetical protein EC844_12616 [Acinetobacter calcoaceticus]